MFRQNEVELPKVIPEIAQLQAGDISEDDCIKKILAQIEKLRKSTGEHVLFGKEKVKMAKRLAQLKEEKKRVKLKQIHICTQCSNPFVSVQEGCVGCGKFVEYTTMP